MRTNWKELIYELQRLDPSGAGVLDQKQLRQLLFKIEVDMTEQQARPAQKSRPALCGAHS